MEVVIEYEDSTVDVGGAQDWTTMRSDGVQSVTLVNGRYKTEFAGASLYWLYPEGETWVAGQTGVKYDPNPIVEIVTLPDGTQIERRCPYLPDLQHATVKLGWWNGEDVLYT